MAGGLVFAAAVTGRLLDAQGDQPTSLPTGSPATIGRHAEAVAPITMATTTANNKSSTKMMESTRPKATAKGAITTEAMASAATRARTRGESPG